MAAAVPRLLTFGFREEPRPKGHGYLYWKMDPDEHERPLQHCDLFEIREEVVSAMFEAALTRVANHLKIERSDLSGIKVSTENMSVHAEGILRRVIGRALR